MKNSFKTLEQQLVLELTRFLDYDSELLELLLSKPLDMPWVLGQLCWHRVAGIAYYILRESNLLYKTNRDFRSSLQSIYESGCRKNSASMQALSYLGQLFTGVDFAYAVLKGPFLSAAVYPEGLRTSNDFDFLVSTSNVSACEKLMKRAGFIQGYYQPGKEIVPASRQQIVESRLTRGETVPLLKKSDISGLDVIEIDLNFSLDFKAGEESQISEMLKNVVLFSPQTSCQLCTLSPVDFVIHLCTHLYKEASVYFWVERNRDLSIYKFCDIYALLFKWGEKSFFRTFADRIQQFGVQKECCYALAGTLACYPSLSNVDGFQDLLKEITPPDISFMKEVIQPKTGEVYSYEYSFLDWLFLSKRCSKLSLKIKGGSL